MKILGRCIRCGKITTKYQTNPYDEEIYNDSKKHWLCNKCYWDFYNDI